MSGTGVPLAAGWAAARAARVVDYLTLLKPRVAWMVVFTTLAAYLLGGGLGIEPLRAVFLAIGTLLVGGGAMALNMSMERAIDASMERTRHRPIPAGRLRAEEAVAFGVPVAGAGVLLLVLTTNGLTGALAATSLVAYLGIYTPLKRRTPHCTLVGAVPGAMPMLMGYAAAQGRLDVVAWSLFAVLYMWQLPHFLAIGWLYREDYGKAGLPMLPVGDPDGASTGRQTVLQTAALVLVSLVPALRQTGGTGYVVAALLAGAAFLVAGVRFRREPTAGRARGVILTSVVYLPVLLVALVAGHQLGAA